MNSTRGADTESKLYKAVQAMTKEVCGEYAYQNQEDYMKSTRKPDDLSMEA